MEDEWDEFGNLISGGGGEAYAEEQRDAGGAGGGEEWDAAEGGAEDDGAGMLDEASALGGGGAGGGSTLGGGGGGDGGGGGGAPFSGAIVLHEDKKYYPDADEVYGEAEVLVQEEDTQPLTQPLVAPVVARAFSAHEEAPSRTVYEPEFLVGLLRSPARARILTLVGHLHHGKTCLADLLIEATLVDKWDPARAMRYTDARLDEQARGVSLKATPFSVVLPDGEGVSHLLQCVDAPGHVNFADEGAAALRISDGALLCVDAVEGALLGTEVAVRAALAEGAALVLALCKVDRLILDLRLPPADAYFKLVQVIGEVNALVARCALPGAPPPPPFCPAAGNVVFVGAHHGWCFTLESFARRAYGGRAGVAPAALAQRLWGDVWYRQASGSFSRAPPPPGATPAPPPRTFIHYVLEPLYKAYATCLAGEPEAIAALGRELGLAPALLRPALLRSNARPLLKAIVGGWLGGCSGLVDAVARCVPSPAAAAPAAVARLYTGDADSPEAAGMRACDARGVLMVNCVKLLSAPDGKSFFALGRVMSGTVRAGQRVRVLGAGYSAEDGEDMQLAAVRGVSIGQARYRMELGGGEGEGGAGGGAPAGALVLLEGLGDAMVKAATVTSAGEEAADVGIFRPPRFSQQRAASACVNVSVEPLNPSELPRVLAGLRCIVKSYPAAHTRVEESGEHILCGAGELALECMMRDLREMYAGVEVKVSDPVVSFQETVAEQSSIKCFSLTPNKKNKLTMLAEPMEKGLAEDLEAGAVDLAGDRRRAADFFSRSYGWDVLAARGVWALGPSAAAGANALLDDTLPGETDKARLGTVRESLVQGFQWGCREGPLCDEPMRGVRFRLLAAEVAGEGVARGGGQVIPTARRLAYSSFLTAAPRLMEPVYAVEVLCPGEVSRAVADLLAARRGNVVSEAPRPGTFFTLIRGYLPVMDSFGFETELRVATQGLAFPLQSFDHWSVVPGDPLDKSVVLRPLEASPQHALARDFMVKTRRRKGLPEDVVPTRFFDQELLLELLRQEEEGRAL